ncbi:MAG: hypothetical protein SVU32_01340, partial [Candidatus Nanohaloarchaea archaeon]|nr:hypothetical protein [Candidatus Nanohaloarchaea archaeon]
MELRKGFYFSLDAMLAAGIIFMAFFAVMNLDLSQSTPQFARNYQEANTVAEDSIQLMAGQTFAQAFSRQQRERLINTTVLSEEDLNRSVMNVIAILWASNQTESAENLTRAYLDSVVPPGLDYRLKITNEGTSILYSSDNDFTNASLVARSTRLVTGVSRDRPTSGYLAKASLTSLGAVEPQYFYFGGYVGDGNITANLSLPDYRNVVSAQIEADVADNFTLTINGDPAGSYMPTGGNLSADRWTICNQTFHSGRCDSFDPGNNLIQFNLPSNRSSIGGGFIRVNVNDSQSIEAQSSRYQIKRDRLPGVNGVINIFSSFTVPGTLHGLSARIHYESASNIFLEIGNATIFVNDSGRSDETITVSNETMFEKLNGTGMTYRGMSNGTVPFRVGIRNISRLVGEPEDVDAVATVDLSSSMSSQDPNCPDGTPKCKIKLAKEGAKNFTRMILNTTGSRVGLTGFNRFIYSYASLTDNESRLMNEIESWETSNNNCVGCGIIRSINTLINRQITVPLLSSGSRWRYTVTSPGANWSESGFDASAWNTTPTPAGYGGQAVHQLPKADRYWFRTTFSLDTEEFHDPGLSIRQAGATTVFLNGEKIYSSTTNYTGRYWDVHLNRFSRRSGMWHETRHRAGVGNTSWYFGQEEVWHYASNELENGSLVTAPVSIENITSPTLSFNHSLDLEQSAGDTAYIEVNDGSGWQQLDAVTTDTTGWEQETYSLTGVSANGTVRIRFRFVAGSIKDWKDTGLEGWYVDGVRV